jgi:hypothetical protein
MNYRYKQLVKRIQIVLGLAVLTVLPFRSALSQGLNKATLECKSENFRRTVCSAGASVERIRLIEKRSDAACVEGSSFGFSGESIWVDKGCAAKFEVSFRSQSGRDRSSGSIYPSRQRNRSVRFTCKSDQHRIGACYVAGSIVDLRLLGKKSRASCVKNSSFGFRDDAVWVKNGCEGEFEVTYRPNTHSDWEFTNGGPQTRSLICKSDQFRRAACNAGGVISEIRLKNKRSRAACKADSTYGFRFDEIWVTDGCEAEFDVLYFPRR